MWRRSARCARFAGISGTLVLILRVFSGRRAVTTATASCARKRGTLVLSKKPIGGGFGTWGEGGISWGYVFCPQGQTQKLQAGLMHPVEACVHCLSLPRNLFWHPGANAKHRGR